MDRVKSTFLAQFAQVFKVRGFLTIWLLMVVLVATGVFNIISEHAPTVYADGPTIKLSTSSFSFATQSMVTIQGFNYAANEAVNIYWNYTGPGSGLRRTHVIASANGSWTTSIKPPYSPLGTYIIAGVGHTSGLVATAPLQLIPSLHINTKSAGPGTLLTLYGKSFGASENVNIYWDYTGPGSGIFMQAVTSNSAGTFQTTAQIPSTAVYGGTFIAAIGQVTNATASAYFVLYQPMLTLAPLIGSAGTELTFSAYGFHSNESVQIFWNNGTMPINILPTDVHGYLAPTTFTVPASIVPGSYPVTAVGSESNLSITNYFTVVSPTSSLSIDSGPVGTSVAVNGQGYVPNETVNILWNYTGPSTGTSVATVTADATGGVQASFAIPSGTIGTYMVAVVGVTGLSITLNSLIVSDGLAANPATNSLGQNFITSGTGFQAGEKVKLYWDNTSGTPLATASAGVNGNILSRKVAIPSTAAPGMHSLIGVGQMSNTSYSTQVVVNTNWANFGYNSANQRQNASENVLNSTNANNLKLKWTAPIGTNPDGAASPVYANGFVYIATINGKLNAYNGVTGALQWSYDTLTGFANLTSPVIDPVTNTIFFGTLGYLQSQDSGIPSPFYAVDARTGILKWSLIIPLDDYGFPTLAFNTIYVGAAGEGSVGSLLAVDETSGRIVWQIKVGGGVWGAVGVDTSTKMVFTGVGNPADQVIALDAMTGTLKWQYSAVRYRDDDDVGTAMSIFGGLIYVSSKSGVIVGLDELTGAQMWITQIGAHSNGNESSPAISPNGIVYIGSHDHNLYTLDAVSGSILRKTNTLGAIFSSAALANGVVYFASNDWKFYAVDATNGGVLWTYTTGDQTFSSPIVVNGWLYCASRDGNLYAFSL